MLGYNVWLHKYVAFVICGLFAGCAGVMSAYYNGFVSPLDLSLAISAEAILMVILGGTGTLVGPIIGAVVIVALRNFLSIYIERWLIVLGVIFIFTVLYAPDGIMGWINARRREVYRKRFAGVGYSDQTCRGNHPTGSTQPDRHEIPGVG